MPSTLLLRSARVLDVEAGTYLEDHDVLAVEPLRRWHAARGTAGSDAAHP